MVTTTPVWVLEFAGRALPEVAETVDLLERLEQADPQRFSDAFIEAAGGSLLADFQKLYAVCKDLQEGRDVSPYDLMQVAECSWTARTLLETADAFLEECRDREVVELCFALEEHGRAIRRLDSAFRAASEGKSWKWQKQIVTEAKKDARFWQTPDVAPL